MSPMGRHSPTTARVSGRPCEVAIDVSFLLLPATRDLGQEEAFSNGRYEVRCKPPLAQ